MNILTQCKSVNEDFNRVYSDITDVTPIDDWFTLSSLVGKLPSLAHYAVKTQRMCITEAIKTMRDLPEDSDGLIKKGNFYKWKFAERT